MTPGEQFRFGPFQLDVEERELRRDGERIPLTAKAFDLLLALVQGAGRTLDKSKLLESLWPGAAVEESNLSQTIFLLRKALGGNGDGSDYILTVPRRGYKFIGSVSCGPGGNGSTPEDARERPAALPRPARMSRLWPATAVLAVVALAALAFVYFRRPATGLRVVTSTILPPEKTSFSFTTNFGPVALSPDGRRMVFAATGEDGKSQLWIRPLDAAAAQPLDGTEGARLPFWSPDSRWVAFFAGGKLKKVDTQGGPPIVLADAPFPCGGSWSHNGMIVFAPTSGVNTALQKIPSAGGNAVPATAVDVTVGFAHRFPWFLPDGEHFLFIALKSGSRMRLLVGSLDLLASKAIGEADSNAMYAEGRLLYLRERTLVAQPFDAKALRIAGDVVPAAEHVENLAGYEVAVFSVSNTELLAYQSGSGERGTQLTWFDRTGKAVGTIGEAREYYDIQLSPDRKFLAATIADTNKNLDLWTYDLARGLPTRFTFDPAAEVDAVWSPDGRSIVFNSNRKGGTDLYRKAANGSGAEELLYADDKDKNPTSWSPDGKFVLYHTSGTADLFVLPMVPERPGPKGAPALKPVPFLQTKFNEVFAQFSPDGRWVAYSSNQSQQNEIYVAPFSRPTEKHQISLNGGIKPRWRRDGKEIFYLTPDGRLMAAEVRIGEETVEVGAVHALFGGIPPGYFYLYDVSTDGQRILAAVPAGSRKAPEPITLVQNWAAALKK